MILQSLAMLGCVGVALAVIFGLGRFARWRVGKTDNIDELIAKNSAVWRSDESGPMNTMDWEKAARGGEARWRATVKAQERSWRRRPNEKPTGVVVFHARGQ